MFELLQKTTRVVDRRRSIILLKSWREILKKKSTARFFKNVLIRRVTPIELSFSKEQNNGSAYETKIEDKEHQFNYFFEFDTNTKSIIVRIYFNRLSKIKRLSVVYTTKYQEENNKNVYFATLFFHWLEIEQI